MEPYIKDLFYSTVLSETRDLLIRLSKTKLEKKNMKLNNICMFYNMYGVNLYHRGDDAACRYVCAGPGSILGISQTIKQKSYENIQE